MKIVTLKQGRKALYSAKCDTGWTHLGDSLGVHSFRTGEFLISNGAVGDGKAGTLFFDTIELRDGRFSRAKVFGGGSECITPGGMIVLRPGPQNAELKDVGTFRYGSRTWPFAPSLRALTPWWDYPPRTLSPLLRVRGERQKNAPGGRGIEPVSGYARDLRALVAVSDATIHRTPLAYLDAHDGEPFLIASQLGYSDDRGWMKSTSHVEFADRVSTDNYDERRKPKALNTGTCPYFADIAGLNIYDSDCPQDAEHAIRYLRDVIPAAHIGDPVAAFVLSVFAADHACASTPVLNPTPFQFGVGSGLYGRRSQAWRTWAFQHAAETDEMWRDALKDYARVQMPDGNGQWQTTLVGTSNWSPMPNVPDSTDAHRPPFDPSWYGATTDEVFITAHVIASAGDVAQVRKALTPIFEWSTAHGYVPAYVVTAQKPAKPVARLETWWGSQHYHPWIGLGALAALEPEADDWKHWALSISTPSQGRAKDLRDLRDRLRQEVLGRSQTVAMLSVLEAMSL